MKTMVIKRLLWAIIVAAIGLTIAELLVSGFEVQGTLSESLRVLMLAGIVLGLINFFIKPVINLITWPLKWITFGLFGLLVNILLIWIIDVIFSPEISIQGFKGLFLTSLLVWLVSFFTPKNK